MACRRPRLLRFKWLRTTIAATLAACLACVLLLAGTVHALDRNKRITQYIHTFWRTQDGSMPAGMFSITQTSDGFLWLLSLPGDVYRFDGIRFLPWRFPAGLSNRPLAKVFADHAGGLWIVGEHLARLKDGVVTSDFELQGLLPFQSVSEQPDGSLWVGRRAADGPLCHVINAAVKCFGKADGIPISNVDAVLDDGNGGLWLGGEGELVHWHAGRSEMYKLGKYDIFSLARGQEGSLWVGILAEGLGLERLKDGVVKPFVTPTFDGNKLSVTSTLFDHDGNLWVGTDAKGLFRIHGNTVEHYTHTEGLSGDSVWALFEDQEGIVWVGTTSGIDSFRDPVVTTFSALQGLGKDLAAGILASSDGTIWVANAGSLDRIKDGTVSSIRRSGGLPGDQVASILEDHAGNLWVGVDDGLYLFKDGRFRRLPEADHQPLGMVVAMTEDIDGNIWAECASKPSKLVRIRDFQVREVFPRSQVPPGHNLAAAPGGGIWIVTSKGDLLLFRNGMLETKVPLEPRSSALNRQIIAQADGSILVGTENGLVGWRAGTVQRMTTKNGLPCDFVIAFVQDTEKRWWLYTRCGIVEFSDADFQRWWTNPNTIVQNRVYDAFDGAQPNIGSFNAAASTADGRVWFSSGVVVQVVDPSRLSQKLPPAAAYIESVLVDRKEFQATNNLKVPPHPRDLQIDYTSPTFSIPQKVKFRYRLDGYDHDWHEAGTRRQAFYTDLPPGKYSFRVIASNSDGVWNDSAAKLDFFVAPAYYQTNWFRALCAAVFLGVLWTLLQLRLRQQARQFNMTLEARVSERTRIARDLHDTLLQSFQGLLPRFQAAIYKLPEHPVDARETLEAAVDQASLAITEGRDAVQGLRASTVEKNDLAVAIRGVAEELASADTHQSSPAFQVAVEGQPRNLHPILRDEVYRIGAEALRNAFRHAQAHQIEVELRYDEKDFRLRIRDDGRGINREVLSGDGREGHYGLHGMRERAKLVGGELAIWSEVDSGTEVELSIPASRAYTKSLRRFWFSAKLSKKDADAKDAKEKIES
jgi:signal transduction histidine kinase/ligand-binding sensor domain-containing protein